MDKSEVMAFVKRCLDELEVNYDTYDDCIDITFESDDDIFPIQVGIFPYEDTITTFAKIDGMEIPSNRRGAVLEYSNKYNSMYKNHNSKQYNKINYNNHNSKIKVLCKL